MSNERIDPREVRAVLNGLLDWAERTGGWDASAWDRARELRDRIGDVVPSKAPEMLADGHLRCPRCGGDDVQYWEDCVLYRRVERVKHGVLVIDGYYKADDEATRNERLGCGDCGHEWPLPGNEAEFE